LSTTKYAFVICRRTNSLFTCLL